MSARRVRGALAATFAVLACKADLEDYLDEANAHLVPTYICEGDPTPTVAVWEKPGGVKGRVKIYTKNGGRKLCEAPLRREYCAFAAPALTRQDVPLQVRFFQHQEEKGRKNVDYTVLHGPTDTQAFPTTSVVLGDDGTSTVSIATVEHVRCEDSPYGSKNTEKICTSSKRSDGTPVEQCYCPNEGGVYSFGTTPVSVQLPPKGVGIVWEKIDATWFSPRVETRAFTYVDGERHLKFSGPGVDGEQVREVGSTGLGDDKYPAGVWLGTALANEELTFHRDASYEPTTLKIHKLRLSVACRQ
jgi:hypothetical protein